MRSELPWDRAAYVSYPKGVIADRNALATTPIIVPYGVLLVNLEK